MSIPCKGRNAFYSKNRHHLRKRIADLKLAYKSSLKNYVNSEAAILNLKVNVNIIPLKICKLGLITN